MKAITPQQQAHIDSLVCERLTQSPENRELVGTFQNGRNPVLVKMLQSAWDVDQSNESAYYVVKSPEGGLLAYFSLKCGVLYDTFNLEFYKQAKVLQQILQNPATASEEQRQIVNFLKSKYGDIDVLSILKKKAVKAEAILQDIDREKSNPTHQVSSTFPSIELENFCTNSAAKSYWASLGMPRPLGEVVFWSKVMSVVERAEALVGCSHLFLFAADSSENETLVNYYRSRLGFSTTSELGANKPIYDLLCQLMYQTIDNAKAYRSDFFENFNLQRL